MEDEGSIGVGIILGFFLGVLGLIIAVVIGKPLTTKGAIIGFCIDLGLGFVGICCYIAFIFGLMGSIGVGSYACLI